MATDQRIASLFYAQQELSGIAGKQELWVEPSLFDENDGFVTFDVSV